MISGLERAKSEGKKLGRPKINEEVAQKIVNMIRLGTGIIKIAKTVGVGTGTVQRIKENLRSQH